MNYYELLRITYARCSRKTLSRAIDERVVSPRIIDITIATYLPSRENHTVYSFMGEQPSLPFRDVSVEKTRVVRARKRPISGGLWIYPGKQERRVFFSYFFIRALACI